MLVTFKTTAYADITMFGDAATDLLKLMGHSGNIPGAIVGEDVAEALAKLKQNLSEQPEASTDTAQGAEDDDEKSNRVALATRAVPLIELLEAAAASGANILWDT